MSTNIHTDPKDRMNDNHITKLTHTSVKGISATESTDEQDSLKPSTCELDSLNISTDDPASLKLPTTKSTDDSGYLTPSYSRTISIEDNREVQLRRTKSDIEGHKHDTSLENRCNVPNHPITPIYEEDGFLTIDDSKYIIVH